MKDTEETVGEKIRKAIPDWQHECCFPGTCSYRKLQHDGSMRCDSAAVCDYFVPWAEKVEKGGAR